MSSSGVVRVVEPGLFFLQMLGNNLVTAINQDLVALTGTSHATSCADIGSSDTSLNSSSTVKDRSDSLDASYVVSEEAIVIVKSRIKAAV